MSTPRARRRRRVVAAAAALFAFAAGGGLVPPVSARPFVGAPACPTFPADSFWHADVSALPVHAQSATWVASIGTTATLKADFGSGIWDGGPIGIPYTTVAGTQPRVPVTFDYADESDPGPYPVPPDAPVEGGPASTGDRHVLVVDRDACRLWELYSAYPRSGGTAWDAGSGATWDLRSNAMRPLGWTSGDAAGLPILPGLVRYEEVAAGEIDHVIRFTAPRTANAYVWPASHKAPTGGASDSPMGAWFRLKSGFDISGYSAQNQVILRALKKHGMVLADNGSSWFTSGAPDAGWNDDELAALRRVPGSAFEAVDVSGLKVSATSYAAAGAGGGPPPARYHPLAPARILDTRTGTGTGGMSAPVGAGATLDVQVAGRGGVPATGVSAVAMNVTVTEPTAAGYLTLSPSGSARPLASNLNFVPGQTVANLVVVKLGPGGAASLFNVAGSTHVIADVAGWFGDAGTAADGRYEPVVPARLLDTRDGTGGGARLGPGARLDVQVAGRGNVPATEAGAATLDVVATGVTATTYLTVYPTGTPQPLASNLNVGPGDTAANRVISKLGAGGAVTIFNAAGSTDVVVDVGGWFTGSSATGTVTTGTYTPLAPARILDTRDGTGGIAGPLAGGAAVDVQVAGRGGIPVAGARAVVLNVTVTQPVGSGYLTLFPGGTARPWASDLNYAAGETRPNLVVVKVGSAGTVGLFSSTATHAVVDVAGWFS